MWYPGAPLESGTTHIRSETGDHPVTVSELQSHLRVSGDDDYLDSLIAAASGYASRYLGRALRETEITRQWDRKESLHNLRAETTGRRVLYLTYPPVQSVDRVYSIDTDDAETDITDYTEDLISEPARILLRSYTLSRDIAVLRVEYTAGYTDVPDEIRHGIMMHAAYLYEHRGDTDVEHAVAASGAKALYDAYRVVRV